MASSFDVQKVPVFDLPSMSKAMQTLEAIAVKLTEGRKRKGDEATHGYRVRPRDAAFRHNDDKGLRGQ